VIDSPEFELRFVAKRGSWIFCPQDCPPALTLLAGWGGIATRVRQSFGRAVFTFFHTARGSDREKECCNIPFGTFWFYRAVIRSAWRPSRVLDSLFQRTFLQVASLHICYTRKNRCLTTAPAPVGLLPNM